MADREAEAQKPTQGHVAKWWSQDRDPISFLPYHPTDSEKLQYPWREKRRHGICSPQGLARSLYKNSRGRRSLVAQWVKDPALSLLRLKSLLWCRFDPWSRNFHLPRMQPKNNRGCLIYEGGKTALGKKMYMFVQRSGKIQRKLNCPTCIKPSFIKAVMRGITNPQKSFLGP